MIEIVIAMIIAAILGSVGQIFLRMASVNMVLSVKGLLVNWPLYGFGLTYGSAVLLNIWAYRAGGKVSMVYSLVALSYIFTALLAWKLLDEPMNEWILIGSLVIIAGVGLMQYGASVA
jgi:drug/metabolite transporter (DMT)-like permease